MSILYWILGGAVVLLAVDRVLLWLEARRWINYRRTGLNRGAATYHTLQLSSIFVPEMQEVIEVKYGEEQQEDDSGDPPGPDPEESDASADRSMQ